MRIAEVDSSSGWKIWIREGVRDRRKGVVRKGRKGPHLQCVYRQYHMPVRIAAKGLVSSDCL